MSNSLFLFRMWVEHIRSPHNYTNMMFWYMLCEYVPSLGAKK
jgi:hypothetical protein